MGYTRYWEVSDDLAANKPSVVFEKEMLEKVRKIIDIAELKYGIIIKNGWGDDEPEVIETSIWFNGDASKGLDHETFLINTTENRSKFNFCKTARKPYDVVVNAVLKVLEDYGYVENVSSDGINEEDIARALYYEISN